jgi:enterochelin esterase-like enzyme
MTPSAFRWTVLSVLLVASRTTAFAGPPTAQDLIERHRQEKAPVWADGDTATFFYRGEADKVDVLFGGDTRPLTRLADSDVWAVSIRLADLERGVFSYRFLPTTKDQPPPAASGDPPVWRGPKAPAPAAECARLKGTLEHLEIDSKALGTRRKVTVYQPPDHDRRTASRVVYAADGQAIDRFARVLEPLITAGEVPGVVLIGVHHGGYVGGAPDLKTNDEKKDLRLQEYFPGINSRRFADHESFFTTEVPAWAEHRFGVSGERRDRAVFGYSNGGRFAVEMGLRHPDVFGHVFGFSVAGNGRFDWGAGRKDWPRFYLTAGTWEASFHHCTSRLAEQLKERGAAVRFTSRVGGHDTALWRDQFAAALVWVYGKR